MWQILRVLPLAFLFVPLAAATSAPCAAPAPAPEMATVWGKVEGKRAFGTSGLTGANAVATTSNDIVRSLTDSRGCFKLTFRPIPDSPQVQFLFAKDGYRPAVTDFGIYGDSGVFEYFASPVVLTDNGAAGDAQLARNIALLVLVVVLGFALVYFGTLAYKESAPRRAAWAKHRAAAEAARAEQRRLENSDRLAAMEAENQRLQGELRTLRQGQPATRRIAGETNPVAPKGPRPASVILQTKSSAGTIAFWVVSVAVLVLAIWYVLHLANDCYAVEVGSGKKVEWWEFWRYTCP